VLNKNSRHFPKPEENHSGISNAVTWLRDVIACGELIELPRKPLKHSAAGPQPKARHGGNGGNGFWGCVAGENSSQAAEIPADSSTEEPFDRLRAGSGNRGFFGL
jgi:hypothetical protein